VHCYSLLEGDYLELMPRVPPGSVNLILTDLLGA
jgi:DNA modification methylase